MQTKQLYLYDSYKKEFEAKIQNVNGNQVILDQTSFHPLTGGVSYDMGHIKKGDNQHKVLRVEINRETKEITHVLDNAKGLSQGNIVKGILDWERRYRLMRLHTAAHLIAAIMYRDFNALVTGGQVEYEKAKLDFNLPKTEREIFEDAVAKANKEMDKGTALKTYFLDRKEALRMPGIVKLAKRTPPHVKELRIVEIPGIDVQADGGPHINNTREVGEISMVKIENKGKNQRRVYFTVK
ncbi:MAG: alanyl-tRNA editing protein [Candidatus Bathyarchaeota archaeon]|nr:MAG: alanyl-tRNA editing protein [Candidatus Bathyarchaeota archaeon]